jgi:hypothetical protein
MEIAGMMYGVSLSKDGTTKIVCQQMEEASRIADQPEMLSLPETEPVH